MFVLPQLLVGWETHRLGRLDEAPALFKEGARLRRNALAGMEEPRMPRDGLKVSPKIYEDPWGNRGWISMVIW